jgi:hypothetical protein
MVSQALSSIETLRTWHPDAAVDEYRVLFAGIGLCVPDGVTALIEIVEAGNPDERYWAIAGFRSDDLSSLEELLRSVSTDQTRTSTGKQIGTAARRALHRLERQRRRHERWTASSNNEIDRQTE